MEAEPNSVIMANLLTDLERRQATEMVPVFNQIKTFTLHLQRANAPTGCEVMLVLNKLILVLEKQVEAHPRANMGTTIARGAIDALKRRFDLERCKTLSLLCFFNRGAAAYVPSWMTANEQRELKKYVS